MDNRGEGEWTIGRRWGHNRGEVKKLLWITLKWYCTASGQQKRVKETKIVKS